MMHVEVVYASKDRQMLLNLQVAVGSNVLQAIELSGILNQFEDLSIDIQLLRDRVGIYGQSVSLETILQDEDRVEIYRPLMIDPKTARREKAKPFLKLKKIQERLDKRSRYVTKQQDSCF